MRKFTSFIIVLAFCMACTGQTPLFYGTTQDGGASGMGTVFTFNPANNAEAVLSSFTGTNNDGALPQCTLVRDAKNGYLYGTTPSGGTSSGGTVFSVNTATGAENAVWVLGSDTDGAKAYGGLAWDAADSLFYGMTEIGGSNGTGAIYSFNPVTNAEKVVWSFKTSPDAGSPYGSLVFDSSQNLFYGMALGGGTNNDGCIFTFNPVTGVENVVWSFGNDTDGQNPYGELVPNPVNGLYYGVTYYGGSNSAGIIFSFNPATNSEKVVWSFGAGTDGTNPYGDLVFDATNGLFYGTTTLGGSVNELGGVIYSFNPVNNSEQVVWSFGARGDGRLPFSGLTYDVGNGMYYGLTTQGGAYDTASNGPGRGILFSFDPTAGTEKVLWSFGNGTDGTTPYGSLLLYPQPLLQGITTVAATPATINIYPNPASGAFTITGLTIGQTIQVYNGIGQMIIQANAENSSQQLDIAAQPSGIYLIQVLGSDGVLVRGEKLVKVGE